MLGQYHHVLKLIIMQAQIYKITIIYIESHSQQMFPQTANKGPYVQTVFGFIGNYRPIINGAIVKTISKHVGTVCTLGLRGSLRWCYYNCEHQCSEVCLALVVVDRVGFLVYTYRCSERVSIYNSSSFRVENPWNINGSVCAVNVFPAIIRAARLCSVNILLV